MQFRLRVALNALGMLEREARDGHATLQDEVTRLSAHLRCDAPSAPLAEAAFQLNAQLASRLRSGEVPDGTLDLLLTLNRAKLAIASPRTLRSYDMVETQT